MMSSFKTWPVAYLDVLMAVRGCMSVGLTLRIHDNRCNPSTCACRRPSCATVRCPMGVSTDRSWLLSEALMSPKVGMTHLSIIYTLRTTASRTISGRCGGQSADILFAPDVAWRFVCRPYLLMLMIVLLLQPSFDCENGKKPKQPWQDIHSRVIGPGAKDVVANFRDRCAQLHPGLLVCMLHHGPTCTLINNSQLTVLSACVCACACISLENTACEATDG